jgi:16S rRNA (guanine527-N7)-methyltransferase
MIWTEAEKKHLALLEKWRKVMNLVGPGPVYDHFVDAAGSVEGLDATGRWADLGSGAGFPGVALAARYPNAHVVLIESRLKRAGFLKQVVMATGLSNLAVVHGRTEDVDSGFDGVISRAYRPPADYLVDAARLLSPGGRAVLLSGDPPPPMAGWTLRKTTQYPVRVGHRTQTVFVRT